MDVTRGGRLPEDCNSGRRLAAESRPAIKIKNSNAKSCFARARAAAKSHIRHCAWFWGSSSHGYPQVWSFPEVVKKKPAAGPSSGKARGAVLPQGTPESDASHFAAGARPRPYHRETPPTTTGAGGPWQARRVNLSWVTNRFKDCRENLRRPGRGTPSCATRGQIRGLSSASVAVAPSAAPRPRRSAGSDSDRSSRGMP